MTARGVAKIVFSIVVVGVATAAAVYLAGFFFLALSRMNPLQADLGTYYQYWYHYRADRAYQPHLGLSALLAAMVAYGGLLLLAVAAARQPRPLHGAARFATGAEIARAGLFAERGILLGRWGRRYLCLDGQTSVMLAAPARSGKGVGVVIPNALHWPDSLVVLDIRLEAWGIHLSRDTSQADRKGPARTPALPGSGKLTAEGRRGHRRNCPALSG